MTLTRRDFVGASLGVAAAVGGSVAGGIQPWYRRCLRWGQTNITEQDPVRYDIAWWRGYWRETQVQGVIINAGGIVAYYPSRNPLHYRAEFLGGRDLFGELREAARQEGLAVLARMDSNRATEEFYKAHPGWFARDASGEPYRAGDRYVSCIHGPYYEEYIPELLREIAERYKPDGFTDNSWSGLGRGSICYCENCERRFRERTGRPVPRKADWDDPVYREWILWNYARRIEVWELNNRVTRAAGGPDCLWVGMNGGSMSGQARSFRDFKAICERTEIILLDHQRRSDTGTFVENSEAGKRVHGMLGWDKLIPESMPMYHLAGQPFRLSAKPPAEARMWMLAGFAGGIQPWWHHVGAYHEDRRAYRTAPPVMKWHRVNEEFLVNREPVASVGVVWSQRNLDFYGREQPERLVEMPYRGMIQALVRARIPYVVVHADHIERDSARLAALVLPNLAAMSEEQCAAVRRFVARGGSVVATGVTSLYTEMGDRRKEFALAELFRVRAQGTSLTAGGSPERRWAAASAHTYLRLSPELRGRVYGPKAGDEPAPEGARHPVLAGFEETDILPFGGLLEKLEVMSGGTVPLTFIPAFPVFPPETAWMREPKTDIAALVLSTHSSGGRVAYLAADIDRRYALMNLPDHGNLLANLVRWAAGDTIPLRVEGPGLIDCHLYRQPRRLILHLVNLTSAGTWRAPAEELIPVGPHQVSVRLAEGVKGESVQLLVSEAKVAAAMRGGWCSFEVRSIVDHEVAVIG
ncbi:MAG: beta-galactosidase [Bryobacteraceae bacterium]